MKESSKIRKLAFVGDYLPRKCGIATFTSDLLAAVATAHPQSQCLSVSVNDIQDGYEYPEEVRFEIEEQDLSSYIRAADFLNIGNVDIVCLQHEFGIFGGRAGGHILAFLRELRMPVVTTLHTVLREPRTDQRRVMQELISLSTRLVVMAERGRQMLQDIYHAPLAKIDLIPHGIPDIGFVDPAYFKDQFGVEGRVVLLTFGLLSPNKGIEHVLGALPDILAEFPDVVYIVLGSTHPNELREHGEAYRLSLEILAKKNKIEKNVIFYNRFVDLENLKEFIGAADLYITPYLNEAQITSGTLAYAFGSGKAVVSTPYWHAAELLAEDRGVLVPFGDAAAIAREVIGLLRDDTRRHAIRKNAYRIGREMVWSNVAQLYMRSFELSRLEGAALSRKSLLTKTLDQRPRELPELKLDHLWQMTDSTGVFQHAVFSVPNFSEGYCTDDNARAFILAVLLSELGEEQERVRAVATTCGAFLHHAFDTKKNRFHNFMTFDRKWLDERGSEDCHGRALWALGMGVGRSPLRSFQMMAGQLFALALPALTDFTSPRAWAFGLIGIHEYLRRLSGDSMVNQTRESLMSRLVELFDRNASPDWCWFEEELSYDNAKLAHALILSGRASGQEAVYDRGLRALRWLTELQISEKRHFRPIGSNGSTVVAAREPASTSSLLRRKRRYQRVWKPIAPPRTPGGMNRRNGPSTGSSAGTISAWNSTLPRLAAAAMGCTWIGSMGTRGQNPPWLSCCRWPKCGWRRICSRVSNNRSRLKGKRYSLFGFPVNSHLMPIDVKRMTTILKPDQSRVLLRPFSPGDSQRVGRIIARIMSVPEDQVGPLLDVVSAEFSQRHEQISNIFLERFDQIRELLLTDQDISEQRRLLIGSYFLAEYSLESAALFNPSIIPHPDQADLPYGALRFILSLRATGEGHISSITFRTGIIYVDHRIEVFAANGFLTEPRQVPNALYEKPQFVKKLSELGLTSEFTRRVINTLGELFTLEELRAALATEGDRSRLSDVMLREDQEAAQGIWMLARSNYEVQFQPRQSLSERIIFPATPSQRNGIEDARFVYFANDDGTHVYYATFTAFDGKVIMPQLVETPDFLRFRFITLNGPAAENKGMALFPRKINGRYAMLSRQDNENIYLMFSESVYFWQERKVLLKPTFPWELVQLGNCGSPIETDAGWLVLSHGVGPMRKYCIGAFLLDSDDPSKVLGRLHEPLLKPNHNEREGYVPNVVYTCGALVHDDELIIPYGLADHATGFATVPLHEVLAAMN